MMTFDARRLKRDAARAQVKRPGSSVGRETTGVTRAVRTNLELIYQLRAAGVTWAAIAEAMSEQGISQRGVKTLTATRLTAIVSGVEAKFRENSAKSLRRGGRSDLACESRNAPAPTENASPVLAQPSRSVSAAKTSPPSTEEEIRREGLNELKRMLRGA